MAPPSMSAAIALALLLAPHAVLGQDGDGTASAATTTTTMAPVLNVSEPVKLTFDENDLYFHVAYYANMQDCETGTTDKGYTAQGYSKVFGSPTCQCIGAVDIQGADAARFNMCKMLENDLYLFQFKDGECDQRVPAYTFRITGVAVENLKAGNCAEAKEGPAEYPVLKIEKGLEVGCICESTGLIEAGVRPQLGFGAAIALLAAIAASASR